MNTHRQYVVVTRPEPGLSETVRDLQSLGWKTIQLPLMQIKLLPYQVPELSDIQAILLTSRQAVYAIKDHFQQQDKDYLYIPVFAVGDMTAADAKQVGFQTVFSAHKDAVALAELIKQSLRPDHGKLLFFVGQDQGDVLTTLLQQNNFEVIRKTVYRAISIQYLSEEFLETLKNDQIKTMLFFSSLTARFFIDLLPKNYQILCKSIQAIAISQKAQLPLQEIQWKQIDIAELPNTKAMLSLMQKAPL